MNLAASLRKSLVGSPIVATTLYGGLVIILLFMGTNSVIDILSQRASVAALATVLEQLESRRPLPAKSGAAGMPSGSPFLEGATMTVAGASLLQRVAAAVTKAGGNVLPSQPDVQGPYAKAGFISMVANCEISQSALQPLLYDLE